MGKNKKYYRLTALILFSIIILSASETGSLRFDDNIIEIGATQSEVFLIAGQPLNRRVVGVIKSTKSEIFIEVWTYRVDWYGSSEYYDLIFWGNYLKKIIWLRDVE